MKKKFKTTQSISLFVPIIYLLGIWKKEFQELPPNQSFQLNYKKKTIKLDKGEL